MPYRAWPVSGFTESVTLVSDRAGHVDPRLRAFGVRLRTAREERGLTREQLAEAAGVGVRHLARVEAGQGSATVAWLLDVTAALKLPTGALFDEAPPATRTP